MMLNNKLAVLMPVYNGENYLKEAIDSILNQTYKEFDILIINDGSTDNSEKIVKQFKDSRIKYINNDRNTGLISTLNKGLDLIQSEYIARMDQDDISLPERLAAQVMFMEKHPEVGICGTWVAFIGKHSGKSWKPPIDDVTLKCQLLFSVPFAHPTVMMRRSLFTNFNLRYPAYTHAEDYALWAQAALCTKFANIPQILLSYRHPDCQVRQVYRMEQVLSTKNVQRGLLARSSIYPTEDEIELHNALGECRLLHDRHFIARANAWLRKLDLANQCSKTYQEPHFSQVLSERRFWHFPFKMSFKTSLQLAILTLSPSKAYMTLRRLWHLTHPREKWFK